MPTTRRRCHNSTNHSLRTQTNNKSYIELSFILFYFYVPIVLVPYLLLYTGG